jgi:hypothetical protein
LASASASAAFTTLTFCASAFSTAATRRRRAALISAAMKFEIQSGPELPGTLHWMQCSNPQGRLSSPISHREAGARREKGKQHLLLCPVRESIAYAFWLSSHCARPCKHAPFMASRTLMAGSMSVTSAWMIRYPASGPEALLLLPLPDWGTDGHDCGT